MDAQWASVIVAGVSVAIAIGALGVAVAANRRASAANSIAADANEIAEAANQIAAAANRRADDIHDLNRRADEREREFRDVTWSIGWSPWEHPSGMPAVQLTNTGSTPAMQVTLVVVLPRGTQALTVGDMLPGETRTLEVQYGRRGPAHKHIELIRDTAYRVHWSSVLGHPDQTSISASQLG